MVATKKTTKSLELFGTTKKIPNIKLFGTTLTETANMNINEMGLKILEKTVQKAY